MNTKKRTRKSSKAVSTVISVLLMIIIVVAASLMSYAWIIGYISFTTNKTSKLIQIQSIALIEDELRIYVQNVGEGTVKFNPDECLYVDDKLARGTLDPPSTYIQQGETLEISAGGFGAFGGKTVKIKVVTLEGVFMEATTLLTKTLATNQAPMAIANSYSTSVNTPLIVPSALGVLENDDDPDGDSLTAAKESDASHGSVTLNSDGSFTYSPVVDYVGLDFFTYKAYDGSLYSAEATVTITVGTDNDPPVALNDGYGVDEDTQLNVPAIIGVLINDYDPDGDSTTAVPFSVTSHGVLELSSDGSFTYTLDSNYFGSDSFTYRAYDGVLFSTVATVTITISPVNDAPVAASDSYSTGEDTILNVPASGVLGNDFDADSITLTAVKVSDPLHGYVTLNFDGSFVYNPVVDYYGTDLFTYKVNDEASDSNTVSVYITVNPINDAPIAVADSYTTGQDMVLNIMLPGVLGNDMDPDEDSLRAILVAEPLNGILTLNQDGSFSYRPNAGYYGIDSFNYKTYDGRLDSNTVTVAIDVTQVQVGSITIVKNAMPESDRVFNFIGNGSIGSFTLYGNGQDSTTFQSLPTGKYNISEVVPIGWILDSITIVDPSGGSFSDKSYALIDLSIGENVIVIFTNQQIQLPDDFTIIVLPDTQFYSANINGVGVQIFNNQTQWTVNNVEGMNILFVTHLGDVVDDYTNVIQWQNADQSMSRLEDQVPCAVLPGNHDGYNVGSPNEDLSNYINYFGAPNSFQLFSVGSDDYLIFHLQYNANSNVLAWANTIIAQYPNRRVIVSTHSYLNLDGSRTTIGQSIWQNFVAPHADQIFLVLCGHMHGEARRTDTVNGNIVYQILSDYQSRTNGGNGWLRILSFHPVEDIIYVSTYSPYLNSYENDSSSAFTLYYDMTSFLP